jgi:hypothetical protein
MLYSTEIGQTVIQTVAGEKVDISLNTLKVTDTAICGPLLVTSQILGDNDQKLGDRNRIMAYERCIVNVIKERINEPRRFIQIVIGPRQTGKTTAVAQALAGYAFPFLSVEATKNESGADWLRAQWYRARQLASFGPALLAIDEVQYVANWSAIVKTLWDEDAASGIDLRVLLTGSSATLIQEGLDESLTGRFELIESTHWTYPECAGAFG